MLELSLSPDGTQLAFIADGPGGQSQLWIRALDTEIGEPIEGTERATFPFWAPDGRRIAFFQQGNLMTLDLETLAIQRIASAPNATGNTPKVPASVGRSRSSAPMCCNHFAAIRSP